LRAKRDVITKMAQKYNLKEPKKI